MRQLWRTLRGHRAPFVVILAAEVTTSGLEALLHPLLLKALFDEAILTADLRRFLVLGLTYLALGLTLNLTGYWIACRRKRFENAFTLVLETELLGRALGLDGRKVSRAGNASYVSRIHNDVSQGCCRPSTCPCASRGRRSPRSSSWGCCCTCPGRPASSCW